ncbi:STAS domain-containing protein [Kitasatospora atroaurantiaca]|uniref:Anti-sigma factor antagonist n=1 Tax=Kitasatospora atroaurantiaca TaxID=285545 RepID=A0A561EK15_9ACTN|nr:STAS domain-containing protein [Kitasatospora atroaurantiaca]TWE15967.1 anti-sigma B factor antagonist [Kitasatospora atroaurantiaca]
MDRDTAGEAGTAGAGQLTVSVSVSALGVVMRPEGELDQDSLEPLRAALDSALLEAPGRLVVDCGGLEFCDSTGLSLLLRSQATAEEAGGSLVLVAPRPIVFRMLEITGVQEVLRVYDTVEEALRQPEGD